MSSAKFISLENGLRVIFIPHKVGSVTCCLRGLAGSNYELPDEIGVAHVLEHLCTYASENYGSPSKLRSLVTANGGRATGTTSRDDVAFLTKTLKQNYEDGIKYLCEIFSRPLLTQENLEKTKKVIAHEVFQNMEDPKRHIGRISYQILFPDQRFSIFNTGRIEDIDKLELSTIINFKNRLYAPSNFVLSICGDLDEKELFKIVSGYFDAVPNFAVGQTLKHKPNYKRAFLIENRDNLNHLHLKIDYHGYTSAQKEKYAAYLLSKLLKTNLKSELTGSGSDPTPSDNAHLNISPYILDASSFNSNSYGLFGIYTAIQSGQLESFFKSFKKVVQKLQKEKVTRTQLDFVKNTTKADFEFALEKTSLRADFYAELFLYRNIAATHEDEINNYFSCTAADILKAANDLLGQEPKITILDKSISKEEVREIYAKVFD